MGQQKRGYRVWLRDHEDYVQCVAVSVDGSRVVSGSHDGTVCIWDGRNGEAVCEPLRQLEEPVSCVGIGADGSRIVSGWEDGTVYVWDWNGVSCDGTVVFRGNTAYSSGEGIKAEAENGQWKYWHRDVDGDLVERDLPMWPLSRDRPSSAVESAKKWCVSYSWETGVCTQPAAQ